MTVEPTANGSGGAAACYDIEKSPHRSTPPDNKRIWDGAAYNDPGTGHDFSEDRFTLYGLDGQRVGIYRIRNRITPPDTINMRFVTMEENVWVGKKLLKTRKGTTTEVVLQDRLGSVLFRYNANTDAKKAYAYYPYGQSRGLNTPDNEDGFGTYTRLDNNENHYADQRYYNAKNGRFHQPDPYQASGGPTDPASWNRYTYVGGDPVNFNDATGLARQVAAPLDGPYSITVTATMPGIPLIDIFGPRRDPAFLGGWSFIPLSVEREMRCERASEPELSSDELEEFLSGVEMDSEEQEELFGSVDGKPNTILA
ncbi:MAG: RHS repeat-associated core domain-containing protein [Bryobacterales bacterium]|nr:RHS repeat-associated core domain-containing protein [Bryobacterales bacterium]